MNLGHRTRKTRRPGVVLFWLVVSLTVIVGIVALTLDGGRLLDERRNVQSAADAAALAAGADLYANYTTNQGLDPNGTAAAAAQAAANGYPASDVTVHIPPQSGTFAGKAGYVEVLVQSSLDASFGQIFTSSPLPVTARAVARGLPLNIGVILLEPSGPDAFLNKSPAFTLVNSPLIVNSSDAAAFDQASFGVVLASRYDVTGGYTNPGGALILGTIRTGLPPDGDPLAFLPIPDSSTAPVVSSSPTTINTPQPTTLQPGVYQGGVSITGASSIVMMPGVYIMEGGGFQVAGMATVVADQVLVYNTNSSTYAAGPISVTSQGQVVLTAPLSGTYQGISLFQNRSLATPLALSGSGLAALGGVIYAAGAPVSLTGNALVGVDLLGGAFVVNSMTVQGTGAINVNIGMNPPRVPDVRLVE
jgi:hypothetical protein